MSRAIFEPDHDLFRETAWRFIDSEIVSNVPIMKDIIGRAIGL